MAKKKILKLTSIIMGLILVVVLLAGCTAKAPSATTNTPTMFDRVNALETDMRAKDTADAKINSRLDKLETLTASIPSNQTLIDAMNKATEAYSKASDAQSKAVDAQTRVANVETRLNNLPSTNSDATIQVLQNEIGGIKSNYVLKSDYEALKNTTVSKSDYDAKIAELVSQINALKTSLNSSSGGGSSGGSSTANTDGLSIVAKDLGTEIFAEAFNFNGDQSIKLTIKNTGTKDISDLRFYLYLQTEDYNLPLNYIETPMTLGGDMSFTLSSSSSDEFAFKSGRISVNAGKTKNYYLTPSVTIKRQSTYQYIGASGALSFTNTGTDTPYTINPDYSISKLQNDLTFDISVEILDYNID